ncbi:hypothetical protein LXL04_016287 [Taraxacum kok-saghyz]
MVSSSVQKCFKYDVFLSFRGEDTRMNFIHHLYHALQQKGIHTYKDDEKIKKGKKISDDLMGSIEDSKFFIIVFSKNYASSSWCLEELVKIMECHKKTEHIVYPVFYDVEPSEVRNQIGAIGEAFARHEKKKGAGKWRIAMKEAADVVGWELKNTVDGHEAIVIRQIVENLSLELRIMNVHIDENLVGMNTRMKDIVSSLGTHSDDVHMIGIWGIGGGGKTTLARAIYNKISFEFECKSFIENVREASTTSLSGLKSLQNHVLSDVLNDQGINVSNEYEGKNMMWRMMRGRKVLLVLDDVDHKDQLEALAGDRSWFKPGSIIIITTRDEQVLVAHGVRSIYAPNLLSDKEANCLFNRYVFGREIPIQGYEELSRHVLRYAAGLPLTIKVLGSFLCGKSKLEWVDALARLKTIPLEEIHKKLELSYSGLNEDYKEMFLDVATILKGSRKDSIITALESCGFHVRIGLRVLEQKSLITIDDKSNNGERVGMHDQIEEMGRNIVRRLHPNMPYKHSRLWIDAEIVHILANDLGTKATRCIKFCNKGLNPEIIMKGLRKMKELRYLYVDQQGVYSNRGINKRKAKFLNAFSALCCIWKVKKNISSYFPDALQYLCWNNYPFQYLPTTFQGNNLVTLEMTDSNIVRLWEGGERKVLKKLRFLNLTGPKLRTFDLRLTPNLETLLLVGQGKLVKLYMPVTCQNLRSLKLKGIKLRTFDLWLTPNLEELWHKGGDLVELRIPLICLNLTSLNLKYLKLRTLDVRLTPNLENLSVKYCHDLEKIHMGDECLKLISLYLEGPKLRTLDLGRSPNLERLDLRGCNDLEEFHIAECPILTDIYISNSKLRTLNLQLIPNLSKLLLYKCKCLVELHLPSGCINLEILRFESCNKLEKLHMTEQCQKLISLDLSYSKLRILDLGLTPNIKRLNLKGCYNLLELHAPTGCLKNLVYLDLGGCLAFRSFQFCFENNPFGVVYESLEVHRLAELHFILKKCPFHPDNKLLKFEFRCFHREDVSSLIRCLQKIIIGGPCACTKLERFSRSIHRLQS